MKCNMRWQVAQAHKNDWHCLPLVLCHSYLHDHFANHVLIQVLTILVIIVVVVTIIIILILVIVTVVVQVQMSITLMMMKRSLHVHDDALTTALYIYILRTMNAQLQKHSTNLINAMKILLKEITSITVVIITTKMVIILRRAVKVTVMRYIILVNSVPHSIY